MTIGELKMKRIIRWIIRWFRRLFHRPTVQIIPLDLKDRQVVKYSKNRFMIVRAGSSMRRGRLLGVR